MDVRVKSIHDFGGVAIVGIIHLEALNKNVYYVGVKLPVIGKKELIDKFIKWSPKQYMKDCKGMAVIWFENFIEVLNQGEFAKESGNLHSGVHTVDKQRIEELRWYNVDPITAITRLDDNF